jgi:hypothetical protein
LARHCAWYARTAAGNLGTTTSIACSRHLAVKRLALNPDSPWSHARLAACRNRQCRVATPFGFRKSRSANDTRTVWTCTSTSSTFPALAIAATPSIIATAVVFIVLLFIGVSCPASVASNTPEIHFTAAE